mmetsp:Transcript_9959/g.23797  ORF Transcript_9959/g.23797 Transcript_9959/m.23797 type:complete len:260 (+) Transcript_9959:1271-2050(+)
MAPTPMSPACARAATPAVSGATDRATGGASISRGSRAPRPPSTPLPAPLARCVRGVRARCRAATMAPGHKGCSASAGLASTSIAMRAAHWMARPASDAASHGAWGCTALRSEASLRLARGTSRATRPRGRGFALTCSSARASPRVRQACTATAVARARHATLAVPRVTARDQAPASAAPTPATRSRAVGAPRSAPEARPPTAPTSACRATTRARHATRRPPSPSGPTSPPAPRAWPRATSLTSTAKPARPSAPTPRGPT